MQGYEPRRLHLVAFVCFVLALVVRLYWVFWVQSPFEAVYSDMGGYVDRALQLLRGVETSYPRLSALWPYGTHYFYAAVFGLLGFEHKASIGVLQAVFCALPSYFFVLFAARFFRGLWAPLILGVVLAFWQPLVWTSGFFLSEVPYVALLYLNTWQCTRMLEARNRGGSVIGAVALGITGAALFALRPQFVLTFALLALLYAFAHPSRLLMPRLRRRLLLVAVPWLFTLGFSAARFHHLTGTWGLISENGQLNRLFADTHIGRVESHWRAANGDPWSFSVAPPTKRLMNEHEFVHVDGYFADPKKLAPIRKRYLRGVSPWQRVARAFRNVTLLWDHNEPWPESERPLTPFRKAAQRGFGQVVRWGVLPLAVAGAVIALRTKVRRPALIVVVHLATLVVLSMLFYPEARYRVPYDPFLLLLALYFVSHAVMRVTRGVHSIRSRQRQAAV